MHWKDVKGGERGMKARVYGRGNFHSASLRAESENTADIFAKDSISKEMAPANQLIPPQGRVVVIQTKTRERMAGETGNSTYALFPDTRGGDCTANVVASCHNTRLYDDFYWDTLLQVERTSDGFVTTEGWERLPITGGMGISFPPKTDLVVTVTCERTAAFRLKCPLIEELNSRLREEGICMTRARRTSTTTRVYCDPVVERAVA